MIHFIWASALVICVLTITGAIAVSAYLKGAALQEVHRLREERDSAYNHTTALRKELRDIKEGTK